MPIDSLATNLLRRLKAIEAKMNELLDASTISYVPNRARRELHRTGVAIGLGDGQWGPTSPTQQDLQRELLALWAPLLEQIQALFADDTKARQHVIKQAAGQVERWLHRSGDLWSLPPTIEEAKAKFTSVTAPLVGLLESLVEPAGRLLVVPDTNVIVRSPDVTRYGSVVGTASYEVVLVPGVLGEIDAHKVNHRVPEFRDRARKVSDRIKGWRNQGKLAEGVKVQGDVYVRVEGREPDFSKTLSWLDRNVVDDRVVASVLELQRRNPSLPLVVLTGDTLMLAKCDMANISTADTPDPEV